MDDRHFSYITKLTQKTLILQGSRLFIIIRDLIKNVMKNIIY
jgi:hypothetical protein